MNRAALQEFLGKLNSATKYPSIPTYHKLGKRGQSTDELQVVFEPDEQLVVEEKIDGTNTRIIVLAEDVIDWKRHCFIGSRQELLHHLDDMVYNTSQGIVEAVFPHALEIWKEAHPWEAAFVLYGEVYGGRIGKAAKQYTSSGDVGFRCFDLRSIPRAVLELPRDQIAAWREADGAWLPDRWVEEVPLVAHLAGRDLPVRAGETGEWLADVIPQTRAALDGGKGRAEGVILRNLNRSKIAKVRFQNYGGL